MKRIRASKCKQKWRERRSVFYVILFIVFVVFVAGYVTAIKVKIFYTDYNINCTSTECIKSSEFFFERINESLDPCLNFYSFACSNFKGTFKLEEVQKLAKHKLKSLAVDPVKAKDSKSVALQKKYYQKCMDLNEIENDNNTALKDIFKSMGGWPFLEGSSWDDNKFEWSKIIEMCKKLGLYYDWFVSIGESDEYLGENFTGKLYINPPENAHYMGDALKHKSYTNLITNVILKLGSAKNDEVLLQANEVVNFENKLAQISKKSKHENYRLKLTRNEIEKHFPETPWSVLLNGLQLSEGEKIDFNVYKYLPKLNNLLLNTHKRVQANYIFWKITESFSSFLTKNIRDEYHTYAKYLDDYNYPNDRAKYCLEITHSVFPYVSEAEYARRVLKDKKNEIQNIVDNIKKVLHHRLDLAQWLSKKDKLNAHTKLDNINVIIGAPDEMFNESKFNKIIGIDKIELNDKQTIIEIILEVDKKRDLFNLDFSKFKITFEKDQLYQGVGNVNSLKYLPNGNILFLPAALLDNIFYNKESFPSLNYGMLGNMIAHEFAHAFGILVNSIGKANEESSWSNETTEGFVQISECLLQNCTNIGLETSANISCLRTFEENFADYAGVNLAYEALNEIKAKKEKIKYLPGLYFDSEQLFWLSYAGVMCSNEKFNESQITHLLPYQRIVGSFQNSKYFGEAFYCAVGDVMNVEKKCQIL